MKEQNIKEARMQGYSENIEREGYYASNEAMIARIDANPYGQVLFGIADYLMEGDDTLSGAASPFGCDVYEMAPTPGAGIIVEMDGKRFEIQVKEVS
jgi:hypothetical protein